METKEDIKKIVSKIEGLSKEIHKDVDNLSLVMSNTDLLTKSCMTLVFLVGELSGVSLQQKKKSVKTTVVSNPNKTIVNRTYVRNSLGQFSKV